jgi:hypothetical protein
LLERILSTTMLHATIQAQILNLMSDLKREIGTWILQITMSGRDQPTARRPPRI